MRRLPVPSAQECLGRRNMKFALPAIGPPLVAATPQTLARDDHSWASRSVRGRHRSLPEGNTGSPSGRPQGQDGRSYIWFVITIKCCDRAAPLFELEQFNTERLAFTRGDPQPNCIPDRERGGANSECRSLDGHERRSPAAASPSAWQTASALRLLPFAPRWLAYMLPCRRFALGLTADDARLGTDAVR